MRLMAIEAGGPVVSVALFEDGLAVGHAFARAPQRQTETLAPLVEALLGEHRWAPGGLGALACANGPGSFTGLRSSMAFGVGWALAVPGLCLVPVPTLQAWAEAYCPAQSAEAAVWLDGRRGQVFRALLARENGGWLDRLEPALVDLDFAVAERRGRPGALLLTDLDLRAEWGAHEAAADSAALALGVGRLACRILAAGAPVGAWQPEYLRRSEAEVLWERLHPGPAGPGAQETGTAPLGLGQGGNGRG